MLPFTLVIMAVKPSPPRKDAALNREQILRVARHLVDEGAPLQLNDVARHAGVGVATTYRHFPTSQALLEAVATPCLQALVDYGEGALASQDPGTAFAEFLGHVIEAQVTDPSLSPVTAATVDQVPYTTELKTRLRTAGGQLLARARDAGAIRADLTDQDLLPLMCGVAYAATVHAGAAHRDAARRYLDMLLTGLRTLSLEIGLTKDRGWAGYLSDTHAVLFWYPFHDWPINSCLQCSEAA
jgi:AcrR family transcriptional regulator